MFCIVVGCDFGGNILVSCSNSPIGGFVLFRKPKSTADDYPDQPADIEETFVKTLNYYNECIVRKKPYIQYSLKLIDESVYEKPEQKDFERKSLDIELALLEQASQMIRLIIPANCSDQSSKKKKPRSKNLEKIIGKIKSLYDLDDEQIKKLILSSEKAILRAAGPISKCPAVNSGSELKSNFEAELMANQEKKLLADGLNLLKTTLDRIRLENLRKVEEKRYKVLQKSSDGSAHITSSSEVKRTSDSLTVSNHKSSGRSREPRSPSIEQPAKRMKTTADISTEGKKSSAHGCSIFDFFKFK